VKGAGNGIDTTDNYARSKILNIMSAANMAGVYQQPP